MEASEMMEGEDLLHNEELFFCYAQLRLKK
jgi:hypothetical protein